MQDPRTIVGLGEALWDCFPDGRKPGGAPMNVAFQAAQLGFQSAVCTRVGRDEAGDAMIEHLRGHGLDTQFVQRDDEHETGRATVDTSRPDHPRFLIHENAAWDYLAFEPRLAELMQRAAAVSFGTLGQRSPVARATIQRCLDGVGDDCLTVFDVNLRQHWYARDVVESSLVRARIVKLNHEEAPIVAELIELGTSDSAPFCRALLARYPRLDAVCITRGGNGCLLADRAGEVDSRSEPVEEVDAVGAGDAFTAALTTALLRGWPLAACGEFANAVGALVVARQGAMPDLRREFAQLLADRRGGA